MRDDSFLTHGLEDALPTPAGSRSVRCDSFFLTYGLVDALPMPWFGKSLHHTGMW